MLTAIGASIDTMEGKVTEARLIEALTQPTPAKVTPDLGEASESLDTLLRDADYVSLHCPLTETTRGLIGRAAIAAMRPGTFVINTGRGALVDEAALAEALASGQIAGAALD